MLFRQEKFAFYSSWSVRQSEIFRNLLKHWILPKALLFNSRVFIVINKHRNQSRLRRSHIEIIPVQITDFSL